MLAGGISTQQLLKSAWIIFKIEEMNIMTTHMYDCFKLPAAHKEAVRIKFQASRTCLSSILSFIFINILLQDRLDYMYLYPNQT